MPKNLNTTSVPTTDVPIENHAQNVNRVLEILLFANTGQLERLLEILEE